MKNKIEDIYKPKDLAIIEDDNGGFIIHEVDEEGNHLSNLLEFNPENSNLSKEMSLLVAEYLVHCYKVANVWRSNHPKRMK